MKLYFSPGACSYAVHIVLEEINAMFELVYIGKKTDIATLEQFSSISPLKSVPTLELDDGIILTQSISILEFLADMNPEYNLLAPIGSLDRTKIITWLSFIATDIHKSFSPLFSLNNITHDKTAQNEIFRWNESNIKKYFGLINNHLDGKCYLECDRFTIADAYLFVVFQWAKYNHIETGMFIFLEKYINNLAMRKSIQRAMKTEANYF